MVADSLKAGLTDCNNRFTNEDSKDKCISTVYNVIKIKIQQIRDDAETCPNSIASIRLGLEEDGGYDDMEFFNDHDEF